MITFSEAKDIVTNREDRTVELIEFAKQADSFELGELLILCKIAPKREGHQAWEILLETYFQTRLFDESISSANRIVKHTEKLVAQVDGVVTESANKLVTHTETLTKQTQEHIKHAEKLTQQTDILISESRQVRFLTWGLLVLTVGLLVLTGALLYIDWHREH